MTLPRYLTCALSVLILEALTAGAVLKALTAYNMWGVM